MSPLPELLTVAEVADALRLTDETIHRWCRNGQLEFIEINGVRRFHRTYIERLVAMRDSGPALAGSSPTPMPGS
jgi:excisionase family DNA binding protein